MWDKPSEDLERNVTNTGTDGSKAKGSINEEAESIILWLFNGMVTMAGRKAVFLLE